MTQLLFGILLSIQPVHAAGMTCDEVMSMVDSGFDASIIGEAIRTSGEAPTASMVECLTNRDAPAAVVAVVAELAGQELPASDSGGDVPDQGQRAAVNRQDIKAAPQPSPAPEPAPSTPLPPQARLPALSVGVETSGSDFVKGPSARVTYRMPFGGKLALSTRASYTPDRGEAGLKDLTHTLVGIAHEGNSEVQFQQPVTVPLWYAAAMLDIGFDHHVGGLSLTPRARVGVGLLAIKEYYATYDERREGQAEFPTALGDPTNMTRNTVLAEIANEFWFPRGVGVAMTLGTVAYYDKKPQYDPEKPVDEAMLYASLRGGIDLLFAFGGPR